MQLKVELGSTKHLHIKFKFPLVQLNGSYRKEMVVDKVKTNTPSVCSYRDTLTFSGISGSLRMKTPRTVLGSGSSGSPVDHVCLSRRPEEGFSGAK